MNDSKTNPGNNKLQSAVDIPVDRDPIPIPVSTIDNIINTICYILATHIVPKWAIGIVAVAGAGLGVLCLYGASGVAGLSNIGMVFGAILGGISSALTITSTTAHAVQACKTQPDGSTVRTPLLNISETTRSLDHKAIVANNLNTPATGLTHVQKLELSSQTAVTQSR